MVTPLAADAAPVDASEPTRQFRVGVNLLWLVPGVVGGSEEYTTRLLRALAQIDHDDLHLTLFALAPFAEAHPDLVARYPTVLTRLDGRSKAERVAVESTWLPYEATRRNIDLLHHAGGVIPPGPAVGRIPAVLTIHDLQPLAMPENFSAVKRRWLTMMLPRSARRARMVMTPSDPTARSVVELLGIPAQRVHTVPHGVEPTPPVPAEQTADVRDRYHLGGPVILYPAITYPHKDHLTLIRAFAQVARSRPEATLVLCGGVGPAEAEVAGAIRASGVGGQVRRTGRVPWSDLDALYSLADVVAVPSRFEGFGAPALEAMSNGRPLVAADATALPWVVGDGGLLVTPGDVEAWASTIGGLLDDPAEAARLAERGRARAADFTWARSGAALAEGYRLAASADEDDNA
ncbi:MAG: glycosyltransferase family 1 protein [Aquihabitans sp.]